MPQFTLPKDFLMGVSTAALQIEGGDRNNNWFEWCEKGHIKDGSHCLNANDHWNRLEEDVALLQKINVETYRMGLEWSRIEPEEGNFDTKAIEHYRKELLLLQKVNIIPLVTLHHFSNPLWFERMGAWKNKKSHEYFQRYVEKVIGELGDLVSDWVTINEPNVYLYNGYITTSWPPGKSSLSSYFGCMKNMILGHIKGYQAIHRIRRERGFLGETKVGVALHTRVFDPYGTKWSEKQLAKLIDHLFHKIFMIGMTSGKISFPMGFGYPLGKGRFYDFLGINYYTRDLIKVNFPKVEILSKEEAEHNDLGWEIYPEGLYRLCRDYYEAYRAPIFITENGVCDEKDSMRSDYIVSHLEQVAQLIENGIPVERYYHWTFIDNFEWVEGESARFGLYHNDFKTQTRTLRESGKLYAKIVKYKAYGENDKN